MAVRLMIVDDHPILCAGVSELFARNDEIEVVGVAYTGRDAIELLSAIQPDVVLLDCQLPDITGVGVADEIRKQGLPVRVLAFSASSDEIHVRGMLSSGAWGYLLKTEDMKTVVEAVLCVARGEHCISQRVSSLVPP